MGLYIVKVNDLFLQQEREDRLVLTKEPQTYGFEFYKDKEKAQITATKLNGEVISLSDTDEVHP